MNDELTNELAKLVNNIARNLSGLTATVVGHEARIRALEGKPEDPELRKAEVKALIDYMGDKSDAEIAASYFSPDDEKDGGHSER